LSHRLALFGAIAEGDTVAENFSTSADCAATLSCLNELGIAIEEAGGRVVIRGAGPRAFRPAPGPLDARNSGSTLRMLAGILAGRPFCSLLTGDASLRKRPVERVAEPLRLMGARLSSTAGGAPLEVCGGDLTGIDWTLPVASAQVKTAVWLAGLQATGVTRVHEPSPSRDHTERLLPLFGVPLLRERGGVGVTGGSVLHGVHFSIPGDVSSAAFLVVAALILPGSEVRIDHVLLNPGRTAFLEVLKSMGAQIEVGFEEEGAEPSGFIVASSSKLVGTHVPPNLVPALIDEVPALAVAACHADGTFTVSGAGELRVKESDRISSLVEGLSRLGARVIEHPDGLTIEGGQPLFGASVRAHGDHRIAMALAIAGLSAAGTTSVEGAESIAVSFPEFEELLAQGLGGTLS
jgi:3-phosphoshikimate 1-carboxyvinyltransferase